MVMIVRNVYEFEPYSKAFDYYHVNKGDDTRALLSEKYRCSFKMTANGLVILFEREEDYNWFVLKWS